MTHLDLFSGIGGFALAADRTWPDVRHVFCEIDPFCQTVLAKHWPHSPIYGDIRQFKFTEPVDLLTGGFPCQPFSVAGKRYGKEDHRDLWPDMFRVIQEAKPTWIIGENVAGFVGMELDRSISDLEGAGYAVQAFDIPAIAVNARHIRHGIWIVAHTDRVAGNVSVQPAQERKQSKASHLGGSSTNLSNADRRNVQRRNSETEKGRSLTGERQARLRNRSPRKHHCQWTTEPDVRRVAHGIPNRVDRIKSLGNSIVPQVAAELMLAIKNLKI